MFTVALLTVSAVAQVRGMSPSGASQSQGTSVAPAPNTAVRGMVPIPLRNGNVPIPGFPGPLIPEAMGIRNPFFNSNVSANGVQLGQQFHLNGFFPFAPIFWPPSFPDYTMQPAQPVPEEPKPPAPTIFERRPVVQRYADPTSTRTAQRDETHETPAQPEREQEPTLLIFKDGRRVEIGNYAIFGDAVYELSPDYRKIPLSELNLPGTVKENEARGTEFHVPGQKGG